MMQPNPFLGAALHSVGALSAASCYTPQKKTKQWAWEIYWVTQATCGWVVLPILGAILTIPEYCGVLKACPSDAMLRSFVLGIIYGIGGLSFGLGIRYIGFSLNYTIAIGISAGLGTLMPLIWNPNKGFVWEIAEKFSTVPGLIVLAGTVLSLVGIIICGWAGALRERGASASPSGFSFKRGVPLAVLAGAFSAIYNFALLAGEPLEKAAVESGASELLKLNAVLPFACGGAWVTSVIWCIIVIIRNRTGPQLFHITQGSLSVYYLMSLLSGAFWYFQFFFYGIGHAHMGAKYGFTSWAIHMALLILFSNIYGKVFREWQGASSLPRRIIHGGMLVIIVATLIITYGNYLGEKAEADTVTSSTSIYEPEWESLKTHPVPQWFRDAKFGIYFHLGPYSVPAYNSEWYSCLMYKPDHKVFKHHKEKYGDQSNFGYKDFIPLLTLEKFNAEELADLFQRAGARFAGCVAEHADGFAMWDSKLTEWDAADMGPKKDVVGLMEKVIRSRGLKFITTFHHDWNWDWYPVWDKRFDCSNPAYAGLYGQPHNKGDEPTPEFYDEWRNKVIEVIEKYRPDLLYFDSKLKIIDEQYRRDLLCYYYNKEAQWGRQVAVTYKDKDLPVGAGILDMERGRMSSLSDAPWLNDDPIDWKSWCHIENPSYKSLDHLVDGLVDVVSKNGTFLLNIGPKANGEIPEPVVDRLLGIGQWLKINGEAIYETRAWTTFGEGPTQVKGDKADETNNVYTAKDIRFTTKPAPSGPVVSLPNPVEGGSTLYAIVLSWPGELVSATRLGGAPSRSQKAEAVAGQVTIKTLHSKQTELKKIRSVRLLGHKDPLKWSQNEDGLTIYLPAVKPCDYAFVFRISP